MFTPWQKENTYNASLTPSPPNQITPPKISNRPTFKSKAVCLYTYITRPELWPKWTMPWPWWSYRGWGQVVHGELSDPGFSDPWPCHFVVQKDHMVVRLEYNQLTWSITHTQTHTQTHTHKHTHACIHKHIHIQVRVHTQTHTHNDNITTYTNMNTFSTTLFLIYSKHKWMCALQVHKHL